MGVAASRKSLDISSKVEKDTSDELVAAVPEDAKVLVCDSLERNADGATERKETLNIDESAGVSNDERTEDETKSNLSAEQVTGAPGTKESEDDDEQKSTQKSEVNANSGAEVKSVACEKVSEDPANGTAIPDKSDEVILGEKDKDIGINSADPPTDPPPPPPPSSDHEDA
ncbi:unnamed protein product [Notodromas monacha]|uniref:Uncharacterized protein n=1 Tax=Notodromas monacha TaxID=399045 RepID=A0A7R9BXI6_9CRUS|nr:unnamed protein product [Notodromas monacha]CAG0923613.1 unnamed protein product [Notodromas monacha]